MIPASKVKLIVDKYNTLEKELASSDISKKDFVRDMALINELTKGSIYRSLGLKHPTQGLFEGLVELSVDPDNTIATEVNQEVLEEYIKLFGDDDDPEIS